MPCVSSALMLLFILCGELTKVFPLVFVFSRLFSIPLVKILFIFNHFLILPKIYFSSVLCSGRTYAAAVLLLQMLFFISKAGKANPAEVLLFVGSCVNCFFVFAFCFMYKLKIRIKNKPELKTQSKLYHFL